ncbi:hypothetical protein [Pseudomonas atacamensis]|uniref:hypothetical protein n=1 Tax=Pseudomonas atacamensis TaxID=2565368 RepID=UPI003CF0564A
MIDKLLTTALACTVLLSPPSAMAWTDDGGKIVFSRGEIDHCSQLALDAGAIMLGRQANEPPYFDRDQYEVPSAARKSMRESLSRMVLTYPVRDTAEERQNDLKDFMKSAKLICIKAYMESVPASPHAQTAAP